MPTLEQQTQFEEEYAKMLEVSESGPVNPEAYKAVWMRQRVADEEGTPLTRVQLEKAIREYYGGSISVQDATALGYVS